MWHYSRRYIMEFHVLIHIFNVKCTDYRNILYWQSTVFQSILKPDTFINIQFLVTGGFPQLYMINVYVNYMICNFTLISWKQFLSLALDVTAWWNTIMSSVPVFMIIVNWNIMIEHDAIFYWLTKPLFP